MALNLEKIQHIFCSLESRNKTENPKYNVIFSIELTNVRLKPLISRTRLVGVHGHRLEWDKNETFQLKILF